MYVSQYLKIATYVPFCDAAPHMLKSVGDSIIRDDVVV